MLSRTSRILFGIAATVAGVLASVSPADLPTSPAIVGCSVVLLALAWLLAKARSLPIFSARGREARSSRQVLDGAD